jgi:hypothetical protein
MSLLLRRVLFQNFDVKIENMTPEVSLMQGMFEIIALYSLGFNYILSFKSAQIDTVCRKMKDLCKALQTKSTLWIFKNIDSFGR